MYIYKKKNQLKDNIKTIYSAHVLNLQSGQYLDFVGINIDNNIKGLFLI